MRERESNKEMRVRRHCALITRRPNSQPANSPTKAPRRRMFSHGAHVEHAIGLFPPPSANSSAVLLLLLLLLLRVTFITLFPLAHSLHYSSLITHPSCTLHILMRLPARVGRPMRCRHSPHSNPFPTSPPMGAIFADGMTLRRRGIMVPRPEPHPACLLLLSFSFLRAEE